jgi:hypothetical protein
VLAAGAGLLLGACGGGSDAATTSVPEDQPPAPGDLDILAAALRLEYVQAGFYDGLGEQEDLDSDDRDLARTIGEHEAEHVEALEQRLDELGGRRPARPRLDLAALMAGDPETVLVRAADLEGLAAGAYLGQIARVAGDDVLAALLSIHAVEARHAAVLCRRVGRSFAPDGAVTPALAPERVQARLEPYLL